MSQSSNPLKQRLVGAVVLVALGVIFIPMLLEHRGGEGVPSFGSNIPEKPKEIKSITKGKKIDLVEPVTPPEQIVAPVDQYTSPAAASDRPTATVPDKAVVSETKQTRKQPTKRVQSRDVRPGAHGWAIQLASFSKRKNALKLRDRLRSRGYSAYIEAVTTDKGRVFRVRVGPETSKEKAEALRQALQKTFKLNGVVLEHP